MTGRIIYDIVWRVDKRGRLSFVTIIAIILSDILSVIAADLASFAVRFSGLLPKKNFDSYLSLVFYIIVLRIAGFYTFRLYDRIKNKTAFEIFVSSVKACTTSSVIIITFLYFLNIESYPRSVAAISCCLTILFVNAWRMAMKRCAESFFGKDAFRSHLVIIGTGKSAKEMAMGAVMNASASCQLMGFIDTGSGTHREVEHEKILGTLKELPFLVKKYSIDEVILADDNIDEKRISDIMGLLSWEGISLKSAPSTYEKLINNLVLYESGVSFLGPTFVAHPVPPWFWALKRTIDIFLSLLLIVFAFPILLFAVILIKISSAGPAFYLQKRTGLNGKPFIVYKLRTMLVDAEKGKKPRWAKIDDVRITPVGKLLRHFRIDELPQLVNVLKNDMSLIGPRPERPYFTSKLMRTIPFYAQRLQAKPGLTGWAQVNYQYTDTEKGAREKLSYDLFYTQNASLALDLLILLKTFKVVLTGQGAH